MALTNLITVFFSRNNEAAGTSRTITLATVGGLVASVMAVLAGFGITIPESMTKIIEYALFAILSGALVYLRKAKD